MTQVKWHPYPNEKPPKTGDYIVTIKGTLKKPLVSFDSYFGEFGVWVNYEIDEIEAWAALPEPYQGDANEVEICHNSTQERRMMSKKLEEIDTFEKCVHGIDIGE